MRYKAKNIAALQIALGGLPDTMRVELEADIGASPKTVGELRRLAAWPENLAITTPQEGDPNSVVKVSKANVATRTAPKSEPRKEVPRVMIKFTFPIDTGNDAMRSGKSRLRPRRPLDADVLRPLNANARQL